MGFRGAVRDRCDMVCQQGRIGSGWGGSHQLSGGGCGDGVAIVRRSSRDVHRLGTTLAFALVVAATAAGCGDQSSTRAGVGNANSTDSGISPSSLAPIPNPAATPAPTLGSEPVPAPTGIARAIARSWVPTATAVPGDLSTVVPNLDLVTVRPGLAWAKAEASATNTAGSIGPCRELASRVSECLLFTYEPYHLEFGYDGGVTYFVTYERGLANSRPDKGKEFVVWRIVDTEMLFPLVYCQDQHYPSNIEVVKVNVIFVYATGDHNFCGLYPH